MVICFIKLYKQKKIYHRAEYKFKTEKKMKLCICLCLVCLFVFLIEKSLYIYCTILINECKDRVAKIIKYKPSALEMIK